MNIDRELLNNAMTNFLEQLDSDLKSLLTTIIEASKNHNVIRYERSIKFTAEDYQKHSNASALNTVLTANEDYFDGLTMNKLTKLLRLVLIVNTEKAQYMYPLLQSAGVDEDGKFFARFNQQIKPTLLLIEEFLLADKLAS